MGSLPWNTDTPYSIASQSDLERLILDTVNKDAAKAQVNPATSNRNILDANGPWHYVGTAAEPPYQGSWADRSGEVTRFRTNALYQTEIEFGCEGGADGDVIFYLPEDYWPRYDSNELVHDNEGGFGRVVTSATDGSVTWHETTVITTITNGDWFYVGNGGSHLVDAVPVSEPPFENSWGNITGFVPCRFRFNALDELEIDIAATGGAVSTIVWTLPSVFWPSYNFEFPVSDGAGGTVDVYVNTMGQVYWSAP